MNNAQYLISIYQNTQTARQSIEDMFPKFRSSKLKELMKEQEEKYRDFSNECISLAKKKNIKLKNNNLFQKSMLWMSINMSTLTNKSSSHIAELFLLGTVRGTIKLYKDLKSNTGIDEEILDIAKRLLDFEEQSYDKIKSYLKS